MLHHHDLVGDLTDHGQIVGDEQVAQPLFSLQVVEQVQHFFFFQAEDGIRDSPE